MAPGGRGASLQLPGRAAALAAASPQCSIPPVQHPSSAASPQCCIPPTAERRTGWRSSRGWSSPALPHRPQSGSTPLHGHPRQPHGTAQAQHTLSTLAWGAPHLESLPSSTGAGITHLYGCSSSSLEALEQQRNNSDLQVSHPAPVLPALSTNRSPTCRAHSLQPQSSCSRPLFPRFQMVLVMLTWCSRFRLLSIAALNARANEPISYARGKPSGRKACHLCPCATHRVISQAQEQ